jgi:hypothetical protein
MIAVTFLMIHTSSYLVYKQISTSYVHPIINVSGSYFKSYILIINALQENCPLPTAIFQSIDIFTYGHLRTVAKSRFLPFFI